MNIAYKRDLTQNRKAHRQALLQHLPIGVFQEGGKVDKECVMNICFKHFLSSHRCIICMEDMNEGDQIRHLPCMHAFHVDCIDDWLTRKFQCPACMEPIEMGLFAAFSLAHEAPTTALVCK